MQITRPINEFEKQNFETLILAIKADRVCLVSSFDLQNQQHVTLVCAVNFYPDSQETVEFIPIARLIDEAPFVRFSSPTRELESQSLRTNTSNRDEESS